MSQQPRKRNNPKSPAAKPRQAAASSEFSVLHPNGVITIKERTVTVREYGWVEGMRVQAACKEFLQAMYLVFGQGNGGPPPAHVVQATFIEHGLTLQWLIAWSITPAADAENAHQFVEAQVKNAQWVASLNDLEGAALMAAWWSVNGPFFIRRFQEMRLAELANLASGSPSGGHASTPS